MQAINNINLNSLIDTLVSYSLHPQDAGTLLHFEHAGFDTTIPAVR